MSDEKDQDQSPEEELDPQKLADEVAGGIEEASGEEGLGFVAHGGEVVNDEDGPYVADIVLKRHSRVGPVVVVVVTEVDERVGRRLGPVAIAAAGEEN